MSLNRAFIPKARELVAQWSRIFTLIPPDVVLAVIANESRFNPKATNLTGGDLERGGAWGLMQMTLKTARGRAAQLRRSSNSAVRAILAKWDGSGPGLLDPSTNIMFGMAELNANMASLGSDPTLAVAAYNRGLGAVRSMVAKGRDVNDLDYVQHVASFQAQLQKEKVA